MDIALNYIEKGAGFPLILEKLILNGANLSPGGVKPAVQIPICIGYGMVSFLALFCKSVILKKELLGLMVNQPGIAPEQLKAVKAQTLVLVGSRDMIRDKHSRLIAESLNRGTYRCLSGTHFIARENPDAFNQAVDQFLREER